MLVCSFISLPAYSFFGLDSQKKTEVCTDVKVSFKSEKAVAVLTNFEYYENAKFALELLQNLAEQQEHRKLTIEEMTLALRVLSFLFLQETDDYNKSIEINLKNGKKISLPYSVELFANLLSAQSSDSGTEEKQVA